MISRINLYLKSKRLERQIKYTLLSLIGQFIAEKESYLEFLQNLVKMDYDEFSKELAAKIAEFAHMQEPGKSDDEEPLSDKQ